MSKTENGSHLYSTRLDIFKLTTIAYLYCYIIIYIIHLYEGYHGSLSNQLMYIGDSVY